MACHVYDFNYVRVMTIAICYMQLKDVEFHVFMSRALIKVMRAKGVQMLEFKGFMINMLKPIGMLFTLCLAHEETLPNHYTTKKKLVFSIRFNPWRSTLISSFECHICM
jgi:hypothetical protein